jgi:uncharacterized iron-regulated membrane protein
LIVDRSGKVVDWVRFEKMSPGRRLRTWIRFTHTGEAGGWLGQTIAALASLGGVVLVWTGISLALRRLSRYQNRRAARLQQEREEAPA